ncbi:MAG: OadG family protein [Planctomycetota bacterium]
MNPDGSVNWYYVWATLIIRWVCVFIILSILALGISIMSKIVAKFVKSGNGRVM